MADQPSSENDKVIYDLVQNSPIGATILRGEKGKLLHANPAFLSLIGAASEDEFAHYHRPDTWADPAVYKQAYSILTSDERLVNFEAERYRLDGTPCWMLINSQRISYQGQKAQIFWQLDITKRKLAEKKASENEAHFRLIFENSPVSIGITRAADSTIVYANQHYADMLGYELHELIGSHAASVWVSQEDRQRFAKIFKQEGHVSRAETRGRRADGQIIWLSVSWQPFTYKDEPCHLFWAYDITAQKESEKTLSIAKEQAEAATQAKSDFLASMSHEIRTPLNGVLGIAELLKSSPLNEDQRQKVDTILSSGQSLLRILNDVLDMSKIESGKIELEVKDFSLTDLIGTASDPFRYLADEKDLTLTVNNTLGEDLNVMGDEVRLRQMLWNLLSNAVKFTKKGQVALTVEPLPDHQNSNQETLSVRFTVADTGTGIAKDRLSSIFAPFTQADNSITRQFGGTGLGLSIVKDLVKLQGGQISVESTLGEGSRFIMIIPFIRVKIALKPTSPKMPAETQVTRQRSLKILVAEDNTVNAAITRAFLEAVGHEVRHAENGQFAIDAAGDNWADLILMDVHMPEKNGIEATEEIRKHINQTIPIIGLTAEAFQDSHDRFKKAGMNKVLTKPFTADQLYAALKDYTRIPT